MSNYWPEDWVVARINYKGKVTYHVVGGWAGGFTGADSWRMNSGILSVRKNDEGYLCFEGRTGSTYFCHPNSYAIRRTNLMGLTYVAQYLEGTLDEATDWLVFDWSNQEQLPNLIAWEK